MAEKTAFPLPAHVAYLEPYTLGFLTGSRAYGTHSESSDYDFKYIYLHPDMLTTVIDSESEYPESLSWTYAKDGGYIKGEDHQIYKFDKFMHMLMKGNPNAIDILHYVHSFAEYYDVTVTGEMLKLLRRLRPYVFTARAYGQYLGHINGVVSEVENRDWHALQEESTEKFDKAKKKLSHAFRLLYTLEGMQEDGEWWNIANNEAQREYVTAVKRETNPDTLAKYSKELRRDSFLRTTPIVVMRESGKLTESKDLSRAINVNYKALVKALM